MKKIVSLRNSSKAALVCILAVFALLATSVAKEARSQGTSVEERPAIIVDGTHWTQTSSGERRAFLIGVGNMIVAEHAYARRHNLEMAPVADQITKAVTNLKLPEIEARITRWYKEHPQELNMPVLGVIWKDLVKNESK